jgi:hypothetical protein
MNPTDQRTMFMESCTSGQLSNILLNLSCLRRPLLPSFLGQQSGLARAGQAEVRLQICLEGSLGNCRTAYLVCHRGSRLVGRRI